MASELGEARKGVRRYNRGRNWRLSDTEMRARRDEADALIRERQIEAGYARRLTVSQLFEGEEYASYREQIKQKGFVTNKATGKTLHVATRKIPDSDELEIVAIAAVARDPGLTQDFIDTVQDFIDKNGSNRSKQIRQYWNIYETEGIISNAVNKYAALLSVGGRFKVRKAKKGKQQKALETAQAILDFFTHNVNAPLADGAATASRGLRALTEQGMRVSLVEGDWMGRQIWGNHQVGTLGTFALPMTIQTLSMEFMVPVTQLAGLGDYWYWKPSDDVVKLIKGDTGDLDKSIKPIVKRLFDSDLVKQIKKNGQALLDPALLSRVKHRSSDRSLYGESYIEPAKLGIRYARAVNNTDMVSMENIINRLMVVMVGSADPNSPYSKPEVAAARATLMQSFFEEPGPNMTIVLQGDDVKVSSHGAMDQMVDLAERHKIGERKIVVSLGIPQAFIDGTSSEGQAAGWAALIAASGMAEHLGNAFANTWTELGNRILEQNGFTDFEVVFEFDRTNLADKTAERTQNRADFVAGALTIYDYLLSMGKDPEAQFRRKCFEKGLDPETTTWEVAFMPPQGLPGQGSNIQGQGPGKVPGQGRTPNNQNPTAGGAGGSGSGTAAPAA